MGGVIVAGQGVELAQPTQGKTFGRRLTDLPALIDGSLEFAAGQVEIAAA
jgi:hypothetical protein